MAAYDKNWTVEEMVLFKKTSELYKSTKMAFAGLRKDR